MEILADKDRQAYKEFLEKNDRCNFQQSIEWGKVKESWKNEIIISRNDNNEIIGGMSILIRKIPVFGNILYVSRGPICDAHDENVLKDLTDGLKELGKKYKAFTIKWEPDIKSDDIKFREIVTKLLP